MADRIQIRRDTAENWTSANPILAQGEFGVETDTLKLKIGDGVTYWRDLRYYHSGSPYIPGTGIDITDFRISNTGIVTLTTGSANGTVKANNTDVAVKGLGSAAYTSSTDYATSEQGSKADNAADKNLSNLTAQGANIGNWSSNVTNCITKIPQDIKLELNNGTLTLKAGSKVYKPNGSGIFDIVNIPNDVIKSDWSSGTGDVLLCVQSNNYLYGAGAGSAGSGTSTSPTTGFYYRTDENYIYPNNDSTRSKLTFPIAIVHITSGAPDKIIEVYNGFGYIGSTVFALPGVKGLIPNGRNADGTVKNSPFTINNVLTTTDVSGATGALEYYVNGSGIYRANIGTNIYDEYKNIIINSSGVQQMITALDMNAYRTNGRVSSFIPKIVLRAVDYNDTDFIAHQAIPSDRYIDLTLPATGGYLTMPADGFLTVGKTTGGTTEYLTIINNTNKMAFAAYPNNAGYTARALIPVSRGDVIQANYSVSGATQYCRFVYANGAK